MMTNPRRGPVHSAFGAGLLACSVACLSACALTPAEPPPTLSSQRIAQIIASPDRSAADRTNDLRRKPEAMLAFIGIRPGMTVLDVSAGGGYTSELLARAIGPAGTVYGQSQPRDPNRAPPAPAAPEGASPPTPAADAAQAQVRPPPSASTTSRRCSTTTIWASWACTGRR